MCDQTASVLTCFPLVVDLGGSARTVIRRAMKDYEDNTCLRFEEYDPASHGDDRIVIRRASW